MDKEVDILGIDAQIKDNFRQEFVKLDMYKDKLVDIINSLNLENIKTREKNNLEKARDELSEHIKDIENNTSLNFYTIESVVLLEKYKDILKEPLKVNFTGKPMRANRNKDEIIREYLDIACKYVDIDICCPKKDKIVCPHCGNKKNFDIIDNDIYICLNCSVQQTVLKNVSSYRDINRINVSTKYTYDRKIHFKDCINQYMGKQNCTIPQSVYDSLEEQFIRHHLIDIEDLDKPNEIKFKNITKDHIIIFLKEIELSKHYENVNLIHYNITGKKPDDISYLVEKLLDDFDQLTELYDKTYKGVDRKNFINTQYVLYELLSRHKHPCQSEDFSILKTIDRKAFHDDVCRHLFSLLGFNFFPII